jgi:intracellular septation protein
MLKKLTINLGIEFGPIIVFLIACQTCTFLHATEIFVVATILALIVSFFERRHLAWFPVIVALTIVLFGALTIIFHNPFFIIFKDTLYNGLFGVILLIGLLFGKGLLKPLFKSLFAMSEKGWRILSLRWAIFFILLALSNEVARAVMNPHDWAVYYKALATLSTMVFAVYQFRLAKKERLPDSTPWGMRIISKV